MKIYSVNLDHETIFLTLSWRICSGDGIITFEDFVQAFRQARKEELAKAVHERQANLRKTFQVWLVW